MYYTAPNIKVSLEYWVRQNSTIVCLVYSLFTRKLCVTGKCCKASVIRWPILVFAAVLGRKHTLCLGLYGNIVSKIVHIYNWTGCMMCVLCFCSTREIKPDGPGIGVRVKVRNPVLPPRRDRNPISSLGPSGMHLKHNYPPKPLNNGYVSSSHHGIVNGNSMPNLAHTKPQGNNYAQKPGNPEIMRRPLR
jgi:hypothetical protein